jgi:hypothetical protein
MAESFRDRVIGELYIEINRRRTVFAAEDGHVAGDAESAGPRGGFGRRFRREFRRSEMTLARIMSSNPVVGPASCYRRAKQEAGGRPFSKYQISCLSRGQYC